MKSTVNFCKKASLYLEKMIYNNMSYVSPMFICGGENSQRGGENFRLASLAICHPPDQNAETASGLNIYLREGKGYLICNQRIQVLDKIWYI